MNDNENSNPQMNNWYQYLTLAAMGFYIALGIVYIFHGYIHPDEGHYLLTGKLVYQGMVPYKDFQYVQSPLYPYFSGSFHLLLGGSLKAGRFFSFSLGFITLAMVARLAKQSHGPGAAAVTSALIGFNPFIIYCFTIVKLFSLTAFLATLSYSIWASERLSNRARYGLSLLIMSLAFGVRMSILPGLAILFLFISILEWRNTKMILFAGLVILCSVSVIFLPFYFFAPEQFLFNLFSYHGLRDMGSSWGSLLIRYEAISGLARDYFFPLLLFFLLLPTVSEMIRRNRHNNYNTATLTGIVLTVSAIHFVSRNAYISTYFSIIFPLFALLTGMAFAEMLDRIDNGQIKKQFLLSVALGCLIMPLALAQSFAIPAIRTNPVNKIVEISNFIKKNTKANDVVWTYNNAIAMGAGRNVLPGTEMNSITFSEAWSRERCKKFRLLNKEMVLGMIEQKIPKVIVVSKRGLAMEYPEFTWVKTGDKESVFAALNRHYKLVKVYKNFGVIPTDETYLYLKRVLK